MREERRERVSFCRSGSRTSSSLMPLHTGICVRVEICWSLRALTVGVSDSGPEACADSLAPLRALLDSKVQRAHPRIIYTPEKRSFARWGEGCRGDCRPPSLGGLTCTTRPTWAGRMPCRRHYDIELTKCCRLSRMYSDMRLLDFLVDGDIQTKKTYT